MADTPKNERTIGRRGFFGAAAAAASASVLAAGARPVLAEEIGDERTKQRYQETDHVKAFYRTNRYYSGS
jgi:anaerobic selenocysteine-containing dehydrogenase